MVLRHCELQIFLADQYLGINWNSKIDLPKRLAYNILIAYLLWCNLKNFNSIYKTFPVRLSTYMIVINDKDKMLNLFVKIQF